MSAARCRFLLESIADLQTRLRARGSDLLIERRHPEDAIPALATRLSDGASAVTLYAHTDVCSEEGDVHAAVKSSLAGAARDGNAVVVKEVWGNTLHDVSDLPFDFPSSVPEVFTQVRSVYTGIAFHGCGGTQTACQCHLVDIRVACDPLTRPVAVARPCGG